MITADKKVLILMLFCLCTKVFAGSIRKYESNNELKLAENYKTITMEKTENEESLIETEIFGKPDFSSVLGLSRFDGGIGFSYHFYKVDDDNICLGIKAFTSSQEKSTLFINNQKECGARCKVYLDKPDARQIFYVWEPLKEIIIDNKKEELVIHTEEKSYSIWIRSEIKELELNIGNFPKLKSIEGLEKFPKLINLSLIGFDY